MSEYLSTTRDDLNRRLRRIEGQVRGVQKMVEEGKTPQSILQQLSAISSAVHGVGLRILQDYYINSLSDPGSLPSHEIKAKSEEFVDLLDRIP